MKLKLLALPFIVALMVFSTPVSAHAANASFFGPIVPEECHCDNQPNPDPHGAPIQTAPDFGCVLQTIQNVINFIVSFSIILFIIYLTIGGFKLVISGGNTEAMSQAKTRLLNVVVGLAVLLCSWILVDFVMKTVGYDEAQFGPWNGILTPDSDVVRCVVARDAEGIVTGSVGLNVGPSGQPTGTTGGTGTGTGGTGSGCTYIPDSQLVAIDGSGHKLLPNNAQRFLKMKAAAAKDGITLVVSSAYRTPEEQLRAWNQNGCSIVNRRAVCKVRTAAIPCSLGGSGSNHSRGTAVDISLNSGTYQWLRKNAANYGFYNNLANDLPHWSESGR